MTAKEADAQRTAMLEALKRHGGNVSAAASELRISRQTFYNRATRHGLHVALGLLADQATRDQQLAPDTRTSRTVGVTEARWRWARIYAIEQGLTASAVVELALDHLRAAVEAAPDRSRS